jgi:RNA polymerase sigma-70 factor (ECF subfamily)
MSDAEDLGALRRFDEEAFAGLVERHHQAMIRIASIYVSTRASAEEVAQETWLAVLRQLDQFEGRSSLKSWIYRILINRAITRAKKEGRMIVLSALAHEEADGDEPAVDPSRFLPGGHRWAGHWAERPEIWTSPESDLLNTETRALLGRAIDALPPVQRQVIILRDVEGIDSREVCNVLGVTETNQRVLLHRARAKVRTALEQYLREKKP